MYFNNFDNLVNANATTYSHVSKETGISKATLSAWKKGDYTPKLDKLQKIADYFKVSIDELIKSDDEKLCNALDGNKAEANQIINLINLLPPEDRKKAYDDIIGYLNTVNKKL